MKVLIWFLCIFGNALLTVLLQLYSGAVLGAIPSVLLFSGMIWLAETLCLQWDVSCLKKKARAEGISLYQYVSRDVSLEILQKLEKMEGHYDNTHAYLKKCRSQRLLTKLQAKILEDAYVSGMYKTVESGCDNRTDAAMPQKTASPDSRDSGVSEGKSVIQLTQHSRSGQKNHPMIKKSGTTGNRLVDNADTP